MNIIRCCNSLTITIIIIFLTKADLTYLILQGSNNTCRNILKNVVTTIRQRPSRPLDKK